ncbi:Armadillo repeat-containing protein 6 [Glycine soja]|nr:Armadillo repeat-containing protein 6 [Glycine max]
MGPAAKTTTMRSISQEAFEELVNENIDDLGMDPTEALQDAIQTLTLQGVDLSGIVTCVPGETNPVIECLDRLRHLETEPDQNLIAQAFNTLHELCANPNSDSNSNVAIATKNGAVELACSLCSKISLAAGSHVVPLVSALNALSSLLHDVQSTGAFHRCDGPRIVMAFLVDNKGNVELLSSGFRVVASAATGDEIVKEAFMELKVDELILEIMSLHRHKGIQSLYDAVCALLMPDDDRVVASQVYGYARKFAKIGIAEALVDSLSAGVSSHDLISACITLRAVAVNDEICKSIAEKGGIDALLRCIDDSGEQGDKAVAKVCCSLLSKLAGSDANKSAIVGKGGMDKLIKLSARFADDPSVLQELPSPKYNDFCCQMDLMIFHVLNYSIIGLQFYCGDPKNGHLKCGNAIMSIISVLSLRSPDNAARAIEAGAGDLAIQAMEKFPAAHQMQRNSCLMIRNLVVRNPENRQVYDLTILLNNGIEKYIRKAKQTHTNCKDAATDALRDLGLDNYNL